MITDYGWRLCLFWRRKSRRSEDDISQQGYCGCCYRGKVIHLFVKFSPKEYYQGIFELTNYTYEDALDENGNTRKEYKFRLKKVKRGIES